MPDERAKLDAEIARAREAIMHPGETIGHYVWYFDAVRERQEWEERNG